MRTLFGMILGAALLTAGAFVHDSSFVGTRADGTPDRPMVNWDIVGRNAGNWSAQLQAWFAQLTGSRPAPQSDNLPAPRPNAN